MTPGWLNDAVRAFGRQMGLPAFALNARDAAALRFENGVSLRLEYAREALFMTAGIAVPAEARALKRLLLLVHPDAPRARVLRAGYLARAGEAVFSVRLDEREVSVTELESAFRLLWAAVEQLRRSVQ